MPPIRSASRNPAAAAVLLAAAVALVVGLCARSSSATEVAFCARAQPGVHCGPGNGRQTAGGNGKVSHDGWPPITGELLIVDDEGRRAEGTPLTDEILGGHGSDTLIGGAGKDIIWGDQHPTGNDTWQHDTLRGGPGNDWIYTSHGTNHVYGGTGADKIIAYYGHGVIDCGPGHDNAEVQENGAYRLISCEHVSHFCVYGHGADGHCLRPGEPGARPKAGS
ncbi:MAG TPA: calcium-binding protein [Solirubrobacteraceae bacterium]|nr:calcium-binding protein [Solirubrobacteraceae bacterium]